MEHIILWHKMIWQALPTMHTTLFFVMTHGWNFLLGLQIFFIYLSFVAVGFFLNFFFQKNYIYIGEYLKNKPVSSLLFGVLTLPMFLLVFFAIAGTAIGLFFIPAFMFIYIFYVFFSLYAIAMVLGEALVKVFDYRDQPYLELFVGTTILFIMSSLPYIGAGLVIVCLLMGMGAVLRLRFGVRE